MPTPLDIDQARRFADSLPELISQFEAQQEPSAPHTVALLRDLHADVIAYVIDPTNAALENRAATAVAEFLHLTDRAMDKGQR